MADRTVTVGSGKTYSTPALAVAGESDFQTGEDNIVFIIDAGQYSYVKIHEYGETVKFTTSASHKLIFKAADNAFHNFQRGQGVRIVNNVNWTSCFTSNSIEYIDFIGIACSNPMTDSANGFGCVAAHITYKNCFAYNCNDNGFIPGIYANIINCVSVGCGKGIYIYYGVAYIYNCTILNNIIGLNIVNYCPAYVKNCYFGNTTNFYVDANSTMYSTTCASSDGSQSTTQILLVACGFTSYTDGSEDVHISSGSSLRDIGTDLSSDSVYAFDTDAFGNTRSGTWDIGAVEYIASGGGTIVPIILAMNHFNGGM